MDPLHKLNRLFYDSIWRRATFRPPDFFATWSVVDEVTRRGERLLEIGPGARPRFPLDRTVFADSSREAVRRLQACGARAFLADAIQLPFADEVFEAACAIDVVEHAAEPRSALAEIGRVLRAGGQLLVAVPIHSRQWTSFDELVGHSVRFDLDELLQMLAGAGLHVDRSAAFGCMPRSGKLLGAGAWVLRRFRGPAAWFEDRIVVPVLRPFQRPPRWQDGLVAAPRQAGVLCLCSKRPSAAPLGARVATKSADLNGQAS